MVVFLGGTSLACQLILTEKSIAALLTIVYKFQYFIRLFNLGWAGFQFSIKLNSLLLTCCFDIFYSKFS